MLERVTALSEAPNSSTPVPRDLSYLHGAMAMRRSAGGKGRGWVATAPIAAGTTLLVEPAILPTVGPQLATDEESTLPLLKAAARALSRNDAHASTLREYASLPHRRSPHAHSASQAQAVTATTPRLPY